MSTTIAPPEVTPPQHRHPYLALFVVVFASAMDLLDVGIVTVAIPQIQSDLGGTYGQGQWFLVAYVISFAVVLITGGRLGDIYGRKRIFQIGVVGFTLLSLACALAQTPEQLIVFRLLQGAAGALMTPQVFAMMQVLFPPEKRGIAFVVYGSVINVAQLAGPILGGVLTSSDLFGLEWRAIFVINVPIGILILIAAAIVVRESKSEHPLKLDPVGIVLIAVISGLVIYPLQMGREHGWPQEMIIMLIVAAPLLLLFVYHQHRRRQHAVVPTSLFRLRSFSAGTFLVLLFFSTISSAFLIIVWYTQIALGWSALQTALGMISWVVGLSVVGTWAVKRAHLLGRRLVGVGSVVTAVGMAAVGVLVGTVGSDLTQWHLLLGFLVVGCGMGFVTAILVNVVLMEVPPSDAGAGGGVLSAAIQYGTAIGVGVVAVIFFGFLAGGGDNQADKTEPQLRASLSAQGVTGADQDRVVSQFRTCVVDQGHAANPYAPPASCQADGLNNPAVTAAIGNAKKDNFADATSNTLWYQVAALLLAALLATLLPGRQAGGGWHTEQPTKDKVASSV